VDDEGEIDMTMPLITVRMNATEQLNGFYHCLAGSGIGEVINDSQQQEEIKEGHVLSCTDRGMEIVWTPPSEKWVESKRKKAFAASFAVQGASFCRRRHDQKNFKERCPDQTRILLLYTYATFTMPLALQEAFLVVATSLDARLWLRA
jgi:hypothetical protein